MDMIFLFLMGFVLYFYISKIAIVNFLGFIYGKLPIIKRGNSFWSSLRYNKEFFLNYDFYEGQRARGLGLSSFLLFIFVIAVMYFAISRPFLIELFGFYGQFLIIIPLITGVVWGIYSYKKDLNLILLRKKNDSEQFKKEQCGERIGEAMGYQAIGYLIILIGIVGILLSFCKIDADTLIQSDNDIISAVITIAEISWMGKGLFLLLGVIIIVAARQLQKKILSSK